MGDYGIFIDWKYYDIGEINDIKDVEQNVLTRDEYYTWQTNYGSYTKEIYETGTMLHQTVYLKNTSLSGGIVIPTGRNNLRFLVGGGIDIRKFTNRSFLDHYASLRSDTYYSTLNAHYYDYEIGSIRIEDLEDKVNYQINPNVTYGIIWGDGLTLNIGFDTKFYPGNTRTEFYIGFGLGGRSKK